MALSFLKWPVAKNLSRGERHLAVTYSLVIVVGALLGLVTLSKLQGQGLNREGAVIARGWLAFSGAVGAGAAARILIRTFGMHGVFGNVCAGFGAVIITLLMGVVGGTLVLPIYGTMFGPWLVVVTFIEWPLLIAPWVGVLVLLHIARRRYETERDTIFLWTPRKNASRQ